MCCDADVLLVCSCPALLSCAVLACPVLLVCWHVLHYCAVLAWTAGIGPVQLREFHHLLGPT